MARSAGSTPRKFHVHFESNSSKPRQFQVLESDVKAAVRRHPELARRLKITVGFDRKMLAEALQTADFLLNSDPPRENLRAMAPRLEWIQTTGAGVDGLMPLDWLPEGCLLTNNSGAHAAKAQDSGAMGLLMLNARIPEVMTAQRAKHWAHAFSSPIAGKTAVVVGFGDVGADADEFLMRTVGAQRHDRRVPGLHEFFSSRVDARLCAPSSRPRARRRNARAPDGRVRDGRRRPGAADPRW